MATGTIPAYTGALDFSTGFDLNSPPGFFCVLNVTPDTANTPSQVTGNYKRGIVLSFPFNDGTNYCGQLFMSKMGNHIYFRAKNSTWGEWKQLTFTS